MTMNVKLLMAGLSLAAFCTFAKEHTPAESNEVVRTLLLRNYVHGDCLNVRPQWDSVSDFRTPERFFATPVDGDWTPEEKKGAFDAYLEGMGRRDYSSESNQYYTVAELAVGRCADMRYTVALPWIKELFLNPTCSHRVRMHVIRSIVPMLPLNLENISFTEKVFTNTTVFAVKERGFLCDFYISRMLEGATNGLCTTSLVQESASRFYQHRKIDATGGLTFDELFAKGIEGYSTSSNRLDFALFILTNSGCDPYDRKHFTAVTNQLLSSGQPLRQLTIGEGGNE